MMSEMSDCGMLCSARATRSAVELAICVTRRSTMIAWLSSTAPMNITAMVRPTARQNLARADDGLAPASDLKANFLGHLNRIYGKTAAPPPGGLKGDYGFIVE